MYIANRKTETPSRWSSTHSSNTLTTTKDIRISSKHPLVYWKSTKYSCSGGLCF
jgi:hypothetical protein